MSKWVTVDEGEDYPHYWLAEIGIGERPADALQISDEEFAEIRGLEDQAAELWARLRALYVKQGKHPAP